MANRVVSTLHNSRVGTVVIRYLRSVSSQSPSQKAVPVSARLTALPLHAFLLLLPLRRVVVVVVAVANGRRAVFRVPIPIRLSGNDGQR